MKTYYKPSQWRGKRMIFESIDPAERKRRAVISLILFSTIILGIVVVWLTR
jgi:predicted nucleic acid-binding Zn ribbon protein